MAKKIDMIKYVFENRPNELRQLVVKYGVSPAQNENDLWKKVNYIVKTFPQDALMDIVSIHPDKNIIMKLAGLPPAQNSTPITSESPVSKLDIENLQSDIKPADKKSGACGCGGSSGCDGSSCKCGGTCGSKKSNVEGDKPATTPAPATTNTTSNNTVSNNALITKDNLPLLIIGSLAVIGGLFILNKKLV